MKKILLFLSFLLMSVNVWGAETLYKETIFNSANNSQGISSYTASWYNTTNGFRVDITNANNNNNGWDYIKLGRKNNASTGSIVTNTSIDKKITKAGIKIDALTASKITSITLYTSTNGNSWTSRGTFTKSVGTQYVEIYSNNQAEDLYYKIEFVCQSGSSNGLITVSHVYFYIEEEDTPCNAVSISLISPVNGTASLSETEVCSGDEIEVTYTPDDGYMLDKILANDVEIENPITITEETTIQVLFKEKPEEPIIDIVEWNPDYIKVDIDNFDGVTAIIENQNTQSVHKENIANDLFFSKYFEAGGYNKMLAIYNGTKDTINLKQYTFRIAKINTAPVNLGNYGNYQDTLMLPNTEILFVHYDETNSAKDCADDIEGYQNWIEVPSSGNLYSHMNFGGRASIGLYKNSSLIDIIGIHDGSVPLQMDKPCTYAKINGLNDDVGFYTYNGDNIKTEEVETNYFLSTNRCMLVRKNTVKDGSNAVIRNYHDGVNDECNDTIPLQFKTLAQEWMGYQIGNGNNSQALTDSTCTGLAYAGHYNYNEYYAQYETIIEETPLSSILQEDGTYKFDYDQLDTLSCTNLKVIAKNDNETIEKSFQIPIMVKVNSLTTDELFTKEGSDCSTCDVVVLPTKTLTVSGTSSNRNVKLYERAKLIVPEEATYNIQSLSFRRNLDSVSSATIIGNLNLNHLYFDLYTDSKSWRFTALPSDFIVKDLKTPSGKKLKFGDDYLLMWYDGEVRATGSQGSNWKSYNLEDEILAGMGFIAGLSDDYKKKEIRFELNKFIIDSESYKKQIGPLFAYGISNPVGPNHKGWNMIGNPYMDYLIIEIRDGIHVDKLVLSNGTSEYLWKYSGEHTTSRYLARPCKETDDDIRNGGYRQEVLDDYPLPPFTGYFVLMGTDGNLVFKNSKPKPMIRRSEYNQEEVFLRLYADDKKMGFFISPNYTEDYDIGEDILVTASDYVASKIGDYSYLYAAIPDTTLEKGIDIVWNTVYDRIYLDREKSDLYTFAYIYIYDGEWHNLFENDYYPTDKPIKLFAKLKKDIPTSEENIPSSKLVKFINDNKIYIVYKGYVYTSEGKLIRKL